MGEASAAGGQCDRGLLRILLVEDSVDDAALVVMELLKGGGAATWERVETRSGFETALESDGWDVIISDFALPTYGGLEALADLRKTGKDIPFILVSGSLTEAVAVNLMRAGAKDFVPKDQLARLPVVVEREVHEARLRADRERMRERLVMSERMATAGMLAAGIAHEINNPLAIVMANLDFLAQALEKLDRVAYRAEIQEPLQDAREASVRIRDIVHDVKLFSRPHEEQRCAVDVVRVMESSVRMAWNEIRHRARLVKVYADVPKVDANEGRLGQVFLNLLVNAAQSMPLGHAPENEIRVVVRANHDGRVIVEVEDTGAGIPKANLERIFEPFFTTKPADVGTGLGLAISHRIVKELGGDIAVQSEVGHGTLFRLSLRAAVTAAPVVTPASAPPSSGRRARILIVDDEVAIVRAIQRSLGERYDVLPVLSGEAALAHIASGERFDIILSDLMMPDVTGMKLHEELLRDAPEQAARMIFLTGGAFTDQAREFLDRVPNLRLDKPFDTTTLLAVIASVAVDAELPRATG